MRLQEWTVTLMRQEGYNVRLQEETVTMMRQEGYNVRLQEETVHHDEAGGL